MGQELAHTLSLPPSVVLLSFSRVCAERERERQWTDYGQSRNGISLKNVQET